MYAKRLLYVIFVAIFWNFITSYRQGIRIDRIDTCGQSKDPQYKLNEVRIYSLDSGINTIYLDIEFKHDIPKLNIHIEIKRCANKEALDTCQSFANLKLSDACKVLEVKGMAWSPFMDTFEPNLKCPIKKGIYICKNGTIDPDLGFFFPLGKWYWKLKYKIIDGHEYMYLCMDIHAIKIK